MYKVCLSWSRMKAYTCYPDAESLPWCNLPPASCPATAAEASVTSLTHLSVDCEFVENFGG